MKKAAILSSAFLLAAIQAGLAASPYKTYFEMAHNFKNDCGGRINSKGAEYVADNVTAGNFDIRVFLDFYDATCEFDQSASMAKKVRKGTLSKKAFDAAFGFKDSCGYRVDSFDAEIAAEAVAKGRFDIDSLLKIHKSICDIDRAMDMAESSRQGEIDREAVRKAMNFKSDCDTYINAEGAEWIGRAVAQRTLDLDTMLSLYKLTCEFDRSGRVAKGVRRGTHSLSAFKAAYGYRGSTLGLGGCSEEIAGRGAEKVAEEAARGSLDTETFLKFYKETCEFDRSLRLAKNSHSSESQSDDRSNTSRDVR